MFYGWFMAALGALIIALGSAPVFYGLPVWNPVVRNAFGWSATQMSGAYAITQVQEGFLGPVAGFLTEKLGARRMVLIGMVVLGLGFVLFSRIQEVWQLYAAFCIMSLGSSLGTWLPVMTVMNQWFERNKSRAMSLAMEGFALGGIIAPLLLAWAIGGADPTESERYGWRTTAMFVGILCLLLAVPLSRLVRNRPEEMGLHPDGDAVPVAKELQVDPGVGPAGNEAEGYTWQEAIKTRTFWFMSIGHAASATAIVTVFVHLGLALDERGFSLDAIGRVIAVYTAVSAVFVLLGGYAGDRLPIRLTAFGFSVLQSASLVVLALAHSTWMLMLFAVMMGVGSGARMPVGFSVRGVYFGRKAYAAITSISLVPMSVLLFAAPVFAGFMRDAIGRYDVPFLAVAGFSFFGSCLFLLMGTPPKEFARTEARS